MKNRWNGFVSVFPPTCKWNHARSSPRTQMAFTQSVIFCQIRHLYRLNPIFRGGEVTKTDASCVGVVVARRLKLPGGANISAVRMNQVASSPLTCYPGCGQECHKMAMFSRLRKITPPRERKWGESASLGLRFGM